MKERFRIVRLILYALLLPLGLLFFGMLVMFLWNLTLPALLHVPPISLWQAIGIFLLSKLLFGGFPGTWKKQGNQWKSNMEEKLSRMTPEEKEDFKKEWRSRCSKAGWTSDKPVKQTQMSESLRD